MPVIQGDEDMLQHGKGGPSVSSLRGIVPPRIRRRRRRARDPARRRQRVRCGGGHRRGTEVTEPYMSGLAGMGMATCYIAAERRVRTLDFITPLPRSFPPRFTSREQIPRGPIAAGTPGNLAGGASWCRLRRK